MRCTRNSLRVFSETVRFGPKRLKCALLVQYPTAIPPHFPLHLKSLLIKQDRRLPQRAAVFSRCMRDIKTNYACLIGKEVSSARRVRCDGISSGHISVPDIQPIPAFSDITEDVAVISLR